MIDSHLPGTKSSTGTPARKKSSWVPNIFRNDKQSNSAGEMSHESVRTVDAPKLVRPAEQEKRQELGDYRSQERARRGDGYSKTEKRVEKPLPETASQSRPRDERKAPPRRRTMSSVDHSDVQLTWDVQKTEIERMIIARDATITQKDAEIRALKLENDRLRRRAEDLEQDHRESKRDGQATAHAQAQLEDEQRRRRRLEKELEQSKQLLDVRTQELSLAQAFMTTADQYSVADVSTMVEQLNDEFFQCAMDMSDALLQHREALSGTDTSRNRKWRDLVEESRKLVARGWSGDTLARLEADIAQDDTIMFECMVQNLFVFAFQEIITSFCLEDREVNKRLRNLWEAILSSHETPIAKNWLAITTSASTIQTRARDDSRLMRYLYALLVIAGWPEAYDSQAVEQMACKRIVDMTAKAGKIREMMLTGILSTSMEVFSCHGGTDFDPTTMQDAYGVPERPASTSRSQAKLAAHGPIVCSTGLGLHCVTRRPKSSTSGSKREVVLKSKVLLCSTLTPADSKQRKR